MLAHPGQLLQGMIDSLLEMASSGAEISGAERGGGGGGTAPWTVRDQVVWLHKNSSAALTFLSALYCHATSVLDLMTKWVLR